MSFNAEESVIIQVSKCVICGGPLCRLKKAIVAPFLAKRIWGTEPFCVDLVRCELCGFVFYNPRLEIEELNLLYQNYHSEEYQRVRYESEPWYTASFNAGMRSPTHYKIHRDILIAILDPLVDRERIRRVLDYGGDRGDLILGMYREAEAFVYDISGARPVDGVVATTDPTSCKADLTISSNVLEHVAFPRDLVAEMLGNSPEGSLIFLEVPCESPFGLRRIFRRLTQIIVVAVTRPNLAKHIFRPAALYTMHEHINYFDEESLTTLMRVSGGNIIASGTFPLPSRAGKGTMAWCLASKPKLVPASGSQ